MCLSLLRQLALYICIIYGTTGPADVPHEGGDDEAHVEVTGQDDHVEEAALSPQGQQKRGLQDLQMWKTEAGQVLLPLAGVYWDSPSTAVPAF